ncbi:MAG TPA: dihydropteroate synthase [Kineosporiaceae bacterium]|nr:dihydropteroate synthase [Kineosporiaceae bacterium]
MKALAPERRVRHPRGLPAELTALDRCLVMGVVNVTPDSFSDGGLWFEPADAIVRGLALAADGADVVDVGGESTRPGAGRTPIDEEIRRVMPVVQALADAGLAVSIDTTRAEVADAALAAGAVLVNDISGGLADPAMADLVADARVPFVAMHWRGTSDRMEELAVYGDVVADVRAELERRVEGLVDAGVDAEHIVLDPGFGFAKRAPHSWTLLARLDELVALGYPLLVGTSRKRFLGQAVTPQGEDPGPQDRDLVTAATTVLAAAAGAWCVRVHEVRASADAVRAVAAVAAARAGAPPGPQGLP